MKVKENPDLVRTSSGAIVNINRKKIQEAKRQKRLLEEKDKQIQEMNSRIEQLEAAVSRLLENSNGS